MGKRKELEKQYQDEKQRIDQTHAAKITQIEATANSFCQQLVAEVRKNKIFCEKSYTNQEMFQQYQKLEKAFSKIIFHDETHKYSDIIDKYPKMSEKVVKLLQDCSRQMRILTSGICGEQKTYNALQVLDDEIIILRNCRYKVDELDCEHDILLITPAGIYTIEVKWLSRNAEITETGMLRLLGGNGKGYTLNVAQQSQRHYHCLRRLFKSVGVSAPPIRHILVMSNDRVTCNNRFSYIDVCYNTTVEYLLRKHMTNNLLTRSEMEKLKQILQLHNKPERKYPSHMDDIEHFVCQVGDEVAKDYKNAQHKMEKKRYEKAMEAAKKPMKDYEKQKEANTEALLEIAHMGYEVLKDFFSV